MSDISSITSCVRYFERVAQKVKRMEAEMKTLIRERPKIRVRVRSGRDDIKQAFGHGVIPKTEWVPGGMRITQEAMASVADYVARKARKEPVVRREWADKAGLSEYTVGEYAKMLREGKIFLDPTDGQWKHTVVGSDVSENEKKLPPLFGERDKNPHGVPLK